LANAQKHNVDKYTLKAISYQKNEILIGPDQAQTKRAAIKERLLE